MSRVCSISGKCPSRGNTRSHSMRATIRVYNPNLQTKKVLDPKTGKMKTMRVAASTLRTLVKTPRVRKTAKKAA